MDRASSKHGPRLDDEMKKEVEPREDENAPDIDEVIEARLAAEKGRTEDPGRPSDDQ